MRIKQMGKVFLYRMFPVIAALTLTGGISMTAYAGGGGDEDEYSGDYYDYLNDEPVPVDDPPETEVPAEENYPPLTPDGNATLIDDYGGNKQLITVMTRNGNYFYIIIDRDDEGENTVHFLNQVDEADLLALIETEEETPEAVTTPAVCTCTEKCRAGEVDVTCEVCRLYHTACTGMEQEDVPEEEPPKKKKGGAVFALVFILLLAGAGGAFYYMKFIRPKQAGNAPDNPDDYDFDDYEDEEEEADDEDDEAFNEDGDAAAEMPVRRQAEEETDENGLTFLTDEFADMALDTQEDDA